MILVFDLDDTLYKESEFFKSGIKAVARYLRDQCDLIEERSFNLMLKQLEAGRNKIFDRALDEYGIYSKTLVRKCLAVYRAHQPTIKLHRVAIDCLERFARYPKYIVTDGNKFVQKNKISVLGLKTKVKRVFMTHCFGVKNAKPSPYCFNLICAAERVPPNEVVYVGDNPAKDFVGIKPLGFRTIRILQGNHRDIKLAPAYEADYTIGSLDEMTEEMIVGVLRNVI